MPINGNATLLISLGCSKRPYMEHVRGHAQFRDLAPQLPAVIWQKGFNDPFLKISIFLLESCYYIWLELTLCEVVWPYHDPKPLFEHPCWAKTIEFSDKRALKILRIFNGLISRKLFEHESWNRFYEFLQLKIPYRQWFREAWSLPRILNSEMSFKPFWENGQNLTNGL